MLRTCAYETTASKRAEQRFLVWDDALERRDFRPRCRSCRVVITTKSNGREAKIEKYSAQIFPLAISLLLSARRNKVVFFLSSSEQLKRKGENKLWVTNIIQMRVIITLNSMKRQVTTSRRPGSEVATILLLCTSDAGLVTPRTESLREKVRMGGGKWGSPPPVPSPSLLL